MAEEEKDPERLLRVSSIVRAIAEATKGHTVGDAQTAISNAICRLCVAVHPDDPDHVFLNTVAGLHEVWILYRAQLAEAAAPDAVPTVLN